jgi:hypothetical protein
MSKSNFANDILLLPCDHHDNHYGLHNKRDRIFNRDEESTNYLAAAALCLGGGTRKANGQRSSQFRESPVSGAIR